MPIRIIQEDTAVAQADLQGSFCGSAFEKLLWEPIPGRQWLAEALSQTQAAA
jgi:hypothetical protein